MKQRIRNFFLCFFLFQVIAVFSNIPTEQLTNPILNIIRFFGIAFMIFFTGVQFFFLAKELLKDARLKAEVQLLEQQNVLKEQQTQQLLQRQNTTYTEQQRSKKSLQQVQTELLSGNYAAATENFKQLSQYFEKVRFQPCCSDNLMNAILDSKRQIAAEYHIQVEYQILLPEYEGILPAKLSSVLFNLLDNGIEACIQSQIAVPFLQLSLTYRDDFLTIHMINSKKKSEPFRRHTTKNDPLYHGFGISIIEEIVEECDGSCEWKDLGDTFEAILLLRQSKLTSLSNPN